MKKHTITWVILLIMSCGISSCDISQLDNNVDVVGVVGLIEGYYSLSSATFTEPVDLYGNGIISTDILGQMKSHGWWYGDYCIDGDNPMDSNVLFPVLTINKIGQANFYVPYPVHPHYFPDDNRCSVGLGCYQFHYCINNDGDLVIDYLEDEILMNGISLHNIKVAIVPESNEIIIRAITNFYDLSRDGWFGGDMTLVYNRISSENRQ